GPARRPGPARRVPRRARRQHVRRAGAAVQLAAGRPAGGVDGGAAALPAADRRVDGDVARGRSTTSDATSAGDLAEGLPARAAGLGNGLSGGDEGRGEPAPADPGGGRSGPSRAVLFGIEPRAGHGGIVRVAGPRSGAGSDIAAAVIGAIATRNGRSDAV